jgi:hypothetical protein
MLGNSPSSTLLGRQRQPLSSEETLQELPPKPQPFRLREPSEAAASQRIERAADTTASGPVQDVGRDHRGRDVRVVKQLLDGPDIVPVLEQVRGEGVTERIRRGALDASGSGFHGTSRGSAAGAHLRAAMGGTG